MTNPTQINQGGAQNQERQPKEQTGANVAKTMNGDEAQKRGDKMQQPQREMMPKNDINRSRGKYPGEAGADWGYGATARPEADEHYVARQQHSGLRGPDMQQADLRDKTANSGNPPMAQGTDTFESLPEGLRRERKDPYDKNVGRNEHATQVPKNWHPKERL